MPLGIGGLHDYIAAHVPARPLRPGELMANLYGCPYRPDPARPGIWQDPGRSLSGNGWGCQHCRLDTPSPSIRPPRGIEALERLKNGPFTLTISIGPPHPPTVGRPALLWNVSGGRDAGSHEPRRSATGPKESTGPGWCDTPSRAATVLGTSRGAMAGTGWPPRRPRETRGPRDAADARAPRARGGAPWPWRGVPWGPALPGAAAA